MGRSGQLLVGLLDRLVRFLRSRRFSGWVIGSWIALLLVWLVPFQVTGQPDETIDAIATEWWPMVAVQVALLLSTLLCTVVRARRDISRALHWDTIPRRVRSREWVEVSTLDEAEERLRRAGMKTTRQGEMVLGVRHPWSSLGGSAFHIALLLLALGLVVESAAAESTTFRLTETQVIGQAIKVDTALAADVARTVGHWRLESVAPEYYRDVLLFTRLDADFDDGSGRQRHLSLSDPLWIGPWRTLTIQDYGFALRISASSIDGVPVSDSVAALNLFPPGNEDAFDIPGTQLRMHAVLYPEHGVVDGRDVSLGYALRNPKILLTLERATDQREVLERALVSPGEGVTTAYGAVTISEIKRFGTFKVNSAPGLWILVIGAGVGIGGLAVRLLVRRLDVVVLEDGGRVFVDAWLDASSPEEAIREARRILSSPPEERAL